MVFFFHILDIHWFLLRLPEVVSGRPELTHPRVELRVRPLLSGVPRGLIEVLNSFSSSLSRINGLVFITIPFGPLLI